MSNQYEIYGLEDPTTNKIRYVGLSKDAQKRFKQHTDPRRAADWVQELLEQEIKPILHIIETGIPDLDTARQQEQKWIRHYEGQGHDLENLVGNKYAQRERQELADRRERLHDKFAKHLPEDKAKQLVEMMMVGYDLVGACPWEDTYIVVVGTINIMISRPDVNIQINEIECAKYTFNILGYEWLPNGKVAKK